MTMINITRQDSLENYRVKSNRVYSTVGDLDELSYNATVTFTGITGINSNNFTGTPAQFTISTNTAGGYTIDAVTTAGSGYEVNDTILVKGSDIGGVDGDNDATITVTEVSAGFGIVTATIAGVSKPSLVAELNKIRVERDAIDTYVGNRDLPGSDVTLTASLATLRDDIDSNDTELADHESRMQSVEAITGIAENSTNLQTTASNIVDAINEVNANADEALAEIGGNMATDYDGDDTEIITALNNLFAASSAQTLNEEFVRRDGVGPMTGELTVSDEGIDSAANSLILKTNGNAAITVNTAGNVGIGKAPGTTKVDVQGTVKATAFNENGATLTATYAGLARNNAMTGVNTFTGDVVIGTERVFDAGTYTFTEYSQDIVGGMFDGNSESGGISAVYNDTTGKITLAIANNAHNHTSSNISDFAEAVQDTVDSMFTHQTTAFSYDDNTGRITLLPEFVQDTVGAMVASPNTEAGISVSYDDTAAKLNFDVNDFTITLQGDVTGTATVSNLGSVSINTTVASAGVSYNEIAGVTEGVQDTVGSMVTNNSESGISVVYQDVDGTLDFSVSAGTGNIQDNAITRDKMADDAVGAAELRAVQTLVIRNSSGSALKTIYGAGA